MEEETKKDSIKKKKEKEKREREVYHLFNESNGRCVEVVKQSKAVANSKTNYKKLYKKL